MAKKITSKIVDAVARLAKLHLTKDEEHVATKEMGRILEYMDRLADVDVKNTAPYASPAVTLDALRADAEDRFVNRGSMIRGDSFRNDLLVTKSVFSDKDDGEQ